MTSKHCGRRSIDPFPVRIFQPLCNIKEKYGYLHCKHIGKNDEQRTENDGIRSRSAYAFCAAFGCIAFKTTDNTNDKAKRNCFQHARHKVDELQATHKTMVE